MWRFSAFVLILAVPACLSQTEPKQTNKYCSSDSDLKFCPTGALWESSADVLPSACRPPRANRGCSVLCRLVPNQPYKNKNVCTNYYGYSYKVTGTGQFCWRWAYPFCAARRQSPISIPTTGEAAKNALQGKKLGTPLNIKVIGTTGVYARYLSVKFNDFTNNGHTISGSVTKPSTVVITGGPFPEGETYYVKDIFFYFGSASAGGSEHHINGKPHDGEIQILAYNSKYGCKEAAEQFCDGLAVISTFVSRTQFRAVPNAARESPAASFNRLSRLYSYFSSRLRTCGKKMRLLRWSLASMLPSTYKTKFYTYQGSLTSPPCSESVRWIIMKNGLRVSSIVWRRLASIRTGGVPTKVMSGNRRLRQALNGRKVVSFF